ncbi:MFS transporter [Kutzneria viridogrisea]
MHNEEPLADTGRHKAVLAVLCSGLLLVTMDNTTLNVALPEIAEELKPSSTEMLWIVDLYSLTVAGLLVTGGTLGDRFGRRLFFLIGMALFGVASITAAFAGTLPVLLATRILRGIGGAMIMPATLSIIRNVFTDARERGVAIGIWAATAAAGTALGPVLTGLALKWFPWGSVFLLSLPIVLAAMALTIIVVPESRAPSPRSFDVTSAALSMAGLGSVVYGIKQVANHGADDLLSLAVLTVGLLLIWIFVRRQTRMPEPLLDLSLFTSRRFTAATLSVLLSFFGFFGLMFFITQYFQIVRHLSPLETGLWMLPLAVASFVASPMTGTIIRTLGTRWTLTGAFILIALSLGLFAMLGGGADLVIITLGFLALGFGSSVVATTGSQAIMSSAPPERSGGAAAIQETAFETGGGLGVAVLGSVMTAVYRATLSVSHDIPSTALDSAAQSLPAAVTAAADLPDPAGADLLTAAHTAFFHGLSIACITGAALMLIVAAIAAAWLPHRRAEQAEEPVV